MRRHHLIIALALTLLVWPALDAARADDEVILEAMRAELARSHAKLHLPGYAAPYFIAYRLEETDHFNAVATLGALFGDGAGKRRRIAVEMRVGDYALDNSSGRSELDHWDPDLDTFNYLNYVELPIDDNVDAIRGRFWRLTDLRFKNALAMYLAKKARLVYREDPDERLDDFSHETPVTHVDPPLTVDIDRDAWREIARQASLVLKEYHELLDTRVEVRAAWETRFLVSTEGTTLVTRAFLFSVVASAQALADDGMTVEHVFTRYARSAAGLPTGDQVLAGVRTMADQLRALRQAPVLEPFTGPAILDPTVAGVFFHEAIGHRLEGDRTRGMDEGKTLKDKLGQAVLPTFLSVIDDPTVARLAGQDLNGTYAFDDEGAPAQRVELIRAGVLVDFLRSRRPILEFTNSNGHGRSSLPRDPMSRMGNLIIQPSKTMPAAKLKSELMRLAREQGKPYGLWLRGGMGGETTTDQYNFQAFANRPLLLFRVDAKTGVEQLVRGAELVGTPLLSVKKVVAAGDDLDVFNGFCGAESGFLPVSAVSPSLLVEEIELQRIQDKPTKPPLLAPPFAP